MNKSFLKHFLFTVLLLIRCGEKLPTRISPVDVTKAFIELSPDFQPNVLPESGEASNGVVLKVGIKNMFDDTFDDNPNIDGYVYILSETEKLLRTIRFSIEDINNVTVNPHDTAWIHVCWDQKDNSGRPLLTTLNVRDSLNFLATARIKFYSNSSNNICKRRNPKNK